MCRVVQRVGPARAAIDIATDASTAANLEAIAAAAAGKIAAFEKAMVVLSVPLEPVMSQVLDWPTAKRVLVPVPPLMVRPPLGMGLPLL